MNIVMESQVYHLFLMILLNCHHIRSQKVLHDIFNETAKVKPCRNIFSDSRCFDWKEFCEGNDFLRLQCAKTCSACQGSPVNGGYSQWSDWSRCSRSCAKGSQRRFRTCTNPSPTSGATDCKRLGPDEESRKCFIRRCPVHGGYSQWSSWFLCSKSCNGGTRYRFRSCTNPMRAHGGMDCRKLGRATESQSCNTPRCPDHGGYSPCSSWNKCSRSCDGGTQARNRSCTNPQPAHGGRNCSELGRATMQRSCNLQSFLIHGGYSSWSSWSVCSKSCDNGTQSRNRSCTNPRPAHGGRNCSNLGKATQQRRCNIQSCPVHGGYSRWHPWSRCSRSCGRGLQYFYRNCNNPRPAHGGRDCRRLGPRYKYQICNTQKCPVDGGYSPWQRLHECSRSCDGGTEHFIRYCDNPWPAHGGKSCSRLGPAEESRSCNSQKCPVHGGYSPWSSWSVCSRSCDGGTQARNRSCTHPRPALGGRNCNKLGNATERRGCNTQSCPVHGGYSQWSDWSPCSRSCNGGSSRRFRSCTSPPPSNGGGNCTALGQALQSMKCNTHKCPVCKNLLDDEYCIKWSKFCSSHPMFQLDCKKACGLCQV